MKVIEIAAHQKVDITAGPEVVYGIINYSFPSSTAGELNDMAGLSPSFLVPDKPMH